MYSADPYMRFYQRVFGKNNVVMPEGYKDVVDNVVECYIIDPVNKTLMREWCGFDLDKPLALREIGARHKMSAELVNRKLDRIAGNLVANLRAYEMLTFGLLDSFEEARERMRLKKFNKSPDVIADKLKKIPFNRIGLNTRASNAIAEYYDISRMTAFEFTLLESRGLRSWPGVGRATITEIVMKQEKLISYYTNLSLVRYQQRYDGYSILAEMSNQYE